MPPRRYRRRHFAIDTLASLADAAAATFAADTPPIFAAIYCRHITLPPPLAADAAECCRRWPPLRLITPYGLLSLMPPD
jgi:hypothetical protein